MSVYSTHFLRIYVFHSLHEADLAELVSKITGVSAKNIIYIFFL